MVSFVGDKFCNIARSVKREEIEGSIFTYQAKNEGVRGVDHDYKEICTMFSLVISCVNQISIASSSSSSSLDSVDSVHIQSNETNGWCWSIGSWSIEEWFLHWHTLPNSIIVREEQFNTEDNAIVTIELTERGKQMTNLIKRELNQVVVVWERSMLDQNPIPSNGACWSLSLRERERGSDNFLYLNFDQCLSSANYQSGLNDSSRNEEKEQNITSRR